MKRTKPLGEWGRSSTQLPKICTCCWWKAHRLTANQTGGEEESGNVTRDNRIRAPQGGFRVDVWQSKASNRRRAVIKGCRVQLVGREKLSRAQTWNCNKCFRMDLGVLKKVKICANWHSEGLMCPQISLKAMKMDKFPAKWHWEPLKRIKPPKQTWYCVDMCWLQPADEFYVAFYGKTVKRNHKNCLIKQIFVIFLWFLTFCSKTLLKMELDTFPFIDAKPTKQILQRNVPIIRYFCVAPQKWKELLKGWKRKGGCWFHNIFAFSQKFDDGMFNLTIVGPKAFENSMIGVTVTDLYASHLASCCPSGVSKCIKHFPSSAGKDWSLQSHEKWLRKANRLFNRLWLAFLTNRWISALQSNHQLSIYCSPNSFFCNVYFAIRKN